MTGLTSHYGLNTMQAGDSFSDNGYKYTYTDRIAIDRYLWLGVEGHVHTGALLSATTPSGAPTLTRSSTGGLIPAATRVYYKVSLVSSSGQESVASTEAFIDTPSPVAEPGAPTLTYATTGGALIGGQYYYAVSAYKSTNSTETKANGTSFISVASVTNTNVVTLTLPSLPAGATGFNIYRRSPSESRFFYLTSTISTTTYVDNGSLAENCDRTIPFVNNTNATNSILVTYPGATPVIPTGYTWRIYRTYINGDYGRSLLTQVVSFTSESSSTIITYYTDTGTPTGSGTPLTVAPVVHSPSKILLTNAAEVQGRLPPANVAGYPYQVEFCYSGTQTVRTGDFAWYCEFDRATIIGCRAVLGVGKSPASTSLIVDVNVGHSNAATPTSQTTIYTTQANRPTITVGNQFSTRTTPNRSALVLGDIVSVDVDQVGGGATPTDANLMVTVYMWVFSDNASSTLP